MNYYLGIDGGGTKTLFSLCDEKGNVLTSFQNETCHYLQVDKQIIINRLNQGIDNICLQANINRKQIKRIFYGCPGYGDIKKDIPIIESIIQEAFENIPFNVGNDGYGCLAAGLAGKSGINIVAGTGSIGFGYNDKTNKIISCGGFHHSIGSDEGSGYWLAYQLLHRFTRQSDGRDEKTALYKKVFDYLKLDEDGEVVSVIVDKWKLDRGKVASLSILVDLLYQENDPYAIEIVNQAVKELFDIIYAIYKKLDFKEEIKVTYSGGVFKMGDKIIKPLESLLKDHHMQLVKPILAPQAGCMLLAMKDDGIIITQEIIKNLAKSH